MVFNIHCPKVNKANCSYLTFKEAAKNIFLSGRTTKVFSPPPP